MSARTTFVSDLILIQIGLIYVPQLYSVRHVIMDNSPAIRTQNSSRNPRAGTCIMTHIRPDTSPSSRDVGDVAARPTVSSTRPTIPRKPVGTSRVLPLTQRPVRLQSTQSHTHRANFFKDWWLEFVACFLLCTMLIAIVASLYPHQGKPLPQWPYRVSVNTLTSIYVVILKGATLLITAEGLGQLKWKWLQNDRSLDSLVKYDQATRGPLGALNLLWRLRLGSPISSIGAFVALVVLVIDPFTQQIIQYYTCSLPIIRAQATIPRTNAYFQSVGRISPKLQAAIKDGVISPNTLVSPKCTTGNCTFEHEYATVGYCSSCMDVTNDLVTRSTYVINNYTNIDRLLNTTGGFTGFLGNSNISVTTFLPSGLSISTHPGRRANLTAMQAFLPPAGSNDSPRVEIILGRQSQLLDPVTAKPPTGCDLPTAKNSWYCKGYGAASCSLSPCVHTYTSTVEAGKLHEVSVSTSNGNWGHTVPPPTESTSTNNFTIDPSQIYIPYLAMIDTKCLSPKERQDLGYAGYTLDPNSKWLAYNLSFTFNQTPQNISSNATSPQSMLANRCMYIIDKLFIAVLWEDFLADFFSGTVVGNTGNDSFGEIHELDGPQVLQTIYNYGNVSFDRVDEIFQNFSKSMTTFFRENPTSNYSTPANGLVMHDQTCLSVRWSWMAFPAILVLLTLIFFIAMIIATRPLGSRAPVWKSSPLPLLFHGFERPISPQRGGASPNGGEDLDDMEILARGIIVRLERTEKGLMLVHFQNQQGKSS